MRSQLSICILVCSDEVVTSIGKVLGGDRYLLTHCQSPEGFWEFIEGNNHLDCLILQAYPELATLTHQLQERSVFLPAVILQDRSESEPSPAIAENPVGKDAENQSGDLSFIYHNAEVLLTTAQIGQIIYSIDRAIAQFLSLSEPLKTKNQSSKAELTAELTAQSLLHRQQRRLAEKLRERLGYLGVYYKRNPQNFLRNLSPRERQKFVEQLKANYRQIVLDYFSKDANLNNKIDEFVNLAFFADIAVTQIVEIHMELMDEFSKQLKLEGRSEEVLLDYRLTLIDVIAHLCEMYRRSIPRDS